MKRNAFVLALCLSAVLPALAQLAPERLPAAVNVPAAAKSAIEVTLVQKKVLAGPKGAERLVDAGTVRPDDVIEYQATYTNTSAKPVTQVVARLPLPAGLAYVPRSARPAEGAALAAQDNQFGPEPLMRRLVAAGSATPLSRYDVTVACTNLLGSTDVSGITALPIQLKPTYGDAIECLLTNTPQAGAPRLAGVVFRDTGDGGGVANDGLRNGAEAGIPGIALRLTDCSTTVHGTTTSDAAGAFSFDVAALASGGSVCVEETNAAGQVSTGASVDGTPVPSSGVPTSVNGTPYVYQRNTSPDRLGFPWSGVAPTGLAFGDVPDNTFVADSARKVEPGLGLSNPHTHTFTAGTAGTVTFTIASATATPVISGWNERIYADKDCTGKLDPAAQLLYPPTGGGTAVTPGQAVCILVQETAPSAAQVGHRNAIQVRAGFDYANAGPALSASYTVVDTTEVDQSALSLVKEVRNLTTGGAWGTNNQARSGDVLEYRVTYTNSSLQTMSAFAINDATPPYTTFVSATAGTLPAALGHCLKQTPQNVPPAPKVDCAATQPSGGSGSIRWIFDGTLGPSATGVVGMTVQVQ